MLVFRSAAAVGAHRGFETVTFVGEFISSYGLTDTSPALTRTGRRPNTGQCPPPAFCGSARAAYTLSACGYRSIDEGEVVGAGPQRVSLATGTSRRELTGPSADGWFTPATVAVCSTFPI